MQKKMMNLFFLSCLTFALCAFSACGGGSDDKTGSDGDSDLEQDTNVDGDTTPDGDTNEGDVEKTLTQCTPTDDTFCFGTELEGGEGPFNYIPHSVMPSGCIKKDGTYTVEFYATADSHTYLLMTFPGYTAAGTYLQSRTGFSLKWSVGDGTVTTNYISTSCTVTINDDEKSGTITDCFLGNQADQNQNFAILGAWKCIELKTE